MLLTLFNNLVYNLKIIKKMKAILLNISAWMLLPFMDGLAKFLSQEIHFLQVVWGRYFFMALFSILIASLFFRKHLRFPKGIKIQVLRK